MKKTQRYVTWEDFLHQYNPRSVSFPDLGRSLEKIGVPLAISHVKRFSASESPSPKLPSGWKPLPNTYVFDPEEVFDIAQRTKSSRIYDKEGVNKEKEAEKIDVETTRYIIDILRRTDSGALLDSLSSSQKPALCFFDVFSSFVLMSKSDEVKKLVFQYIADEENEKSPGVMPFREALLKYEMKPSNGQKLIGEYDKLLSNADDVLNEQYDTGFTVKNVFQRALAAVAKKLGVAYEPSRDVRTAFDNLRNKQQRRSQPEESALPRVTSPKK